MQLGEIIREKRLGLKWSLKQLGTELGVTAAYVADIEATRRMPSEELLMRIASVLKIPSDELEAADSRLSSEVKEWIEERPQVTGLLKTLKSSPDADRLIHRLARLVSRRAKPQVARSFLLTWESELCAMAADASAWSIETGGDLFGRWGEFPTAFLATKAGPKAQREHAHFRLDVEYLRTLSGQLAEDWALRYFGDWHSHHRLGLSSPSGGDRKRIVNVASRNRFSGMTEIITTQEDGHDGTLVRIHPWLYDFSGNDNNPLPLRVRVLPGISPIRQALMAGKDFPEQELFGWEKFPLSRIRIGSDTVAPSLEPTAMVDTVTREKVFNRLTDALRKASGGDVEQHSTGFGSIVVANIREPKHAAFAIGAEWPMEVLDVHLLDRDLGTTESISFPAGLVAADVQGLIDVFQKAKSIGRSHVDG